MPMRVVRNRSAERALLDRIRAKMSQRERHPGLHLSDLLYCSRKAWSRLNQPELWASFPPDDEFTITVFLGFAYHWLLEKQPEQEREIGGIWYTPDEFEVQTKKVVFSEQTHQPVTFDTTHAVNGYLDDVVELIVEFKTTRKSSKKGPTELGNYVDQLAAYCAFTGTRKGRLHVIHIVGQYSPPTPQLRTYDYTFDESEIASWVGEVHRRKAMIEAAPTMYHIPLGEHYASDKPTTSRGANAGIVPDGWECQYCPLKANGHCPGGPGARLPWFSGVEGAEIP